MALIDDFRAFLANCKALFATKGEVGAIEEKIPTQASAQNQLADKNFVNSSIQTATATFRGIMDCWCALGALGSAPDNNDYAVLQRCNDYVPEFIDDPDERHYVGDIFGYDGTVYRVVTAFDGSFDGTKCEKIGELALYGGEPDYAGGVQRYYSYSIEGKTYFRIADWDVDNTDGLSPSDPDWIPANWVLIEETHWAVDTPLATWRWKYAGPSGSGVYAWRAEYKINDAPLTAAQLAALNSNITEALTNKLVALPAKPVDTAAQVLSAAEQAQARTNIGATAPEIFWAEYGVTTAAEIDAATLAGKICVVFDDRRLFIRSREDSNYIYFSCLQATQNFYVRILKATSAWSSGSTAFEQVNEKRTSWSPTPTDTHYPSEKLVYDSLGKRGVIRQTQTWTRAADGGYDYTMSDLVRGLIPQANIDLFTSAGAVFNETTGYFELNGLTDISYEEMMTAYKYSMFIFRNNIGYAYYGIKQHRTIIMPPATRTGGAGCNATWCFYESKIESLDFGLLPINDISQGFRYAQYLRRCKRLNINSISSSGSVSNSFLAAFSLEDLELSGLKVAIDFQSSSRLSLASVVFMVEKAVNTSAITITLHATAYARCVADDTEYTYQGNTYTGIIALANAKQITIASA